MKILIYTTHRTGSTSLANFLMFNLNYEYQRYEYFKNNFNEKSKNIIIKLTPHEITYDGVDYMFDKKIVLIREDIQSQSESRVFSEKFEKKFSQYNIPNNFLKEFNSDILRMNSQIEMENEQLKKLKGCLLLTYEELYLSDVGLIKLEKYLDCKFKFPLEYKRYRNMKQSII